MIPIFRKTALAFATASVFFTAQTQAVLIVFTDLASWQAAVNSVPMGGTQIEDFESSPFGTLAVGTTDIGRFDVTINNNDEGDVRIRDSGSVNGSREFRGDLDDNATTLLQFLFPTLFGFAGDWASTTSGDSLTMTINGQEVRFEDYFSGNGSGFLGVVDFDGFSSINFGRVDPSTRGEAFSLDDARLARVPETANSLMMLCLGLVGLLGFATSFKRLSGRSV